MKIKATSILSDLVQQYVFLVPMLNRFGIRLGLGDRSVREVCQEHGIDLEFFLLIANSCVQPTYASVLHLNADHTVLIVDYMESANRYLLSSQLPNIRVHLQHFITKSGDSNPMVQNIPLVLSELESRLADQVKHDQEVLFPEFRMLALDLGTGINNLTIEPPTYGVHNDDEDDQPVALVDDIIQVLVRHIHGAYDENLLYGVLFSLSSLRYELRTDTHLRRQVFMPMLMTLRHAKSQSDQE